MFGTTGSTDKRLASVTPSRARRFGATSCAAAVRTITVAVHGAPLFAEVFTDLRAASHWHPVLSLDTEIRFHLTPKVHQYVAGLLDGASASYLSALAD